MSARRTPMQPLSPQAAAPISDSGGPMGSFGGLRNWIFGIVVSLVTVLGGAFIQSNSQQIAKLQVQYETLKDVHVKDLQELRERWNAEYTGIIQTQGQNGERLGKLETELRTQHSEIMNRLDRIDATIAAKMH